MPYNQNGGGGAKCINLFIFVSTIMFIIDSSMSISDLKVTSSAHPEKQKQYEYTIDCQTKVLTWISITFFNYYTFIILSYILILMRTDSD